MADLRPNNSNPHTVENQPMKALVYTNPEEITYRDEPVQPPLEGEAQVRVDAVGICGSDMHAFHGHDPRRVPPLILGHEAAGVVETGRCAGQRVVLNPLIGCAQCSDCLGGRSNLCQNRTMIGMTRPGAFAELISIPEQNLIPIPHDMNPVHAALTEPAATALHALARKRKMRIASVPDAIPDSPQILVQRYSASVERASAW